MSVINYLTVKNSSKSGVFLFFFKYEKKTVIRKNIDIRWIICSSKVNVNIFIVSEWRKLLMGIFHGHWFFVSIKNSNFFCNTKWYLISVIFSNIFLIDSCSNNKTEKSILNLDISRLLQHPVKTRFIVQLLTTSYSEAAHYELKNKESYFLIKE